MPREDVILPRIYLSLGNAYLHIEKPKKALEILNHAIRILPDFRDPSGWKPSDDTRDIVAALYNSIGNIYAKTGEDIQAIAPFKEAIKLSKYNLLYYLNLGNIYAKMDKRKEAIKSYDKLVKTMAKSNFYTYLCRGHFYAKISEYEKAIDDFNEAIEILTDNLDRASEDSNYNKKWAVAAFYNRQNAYLKVSNPEKAAEDFNKAKELDPELTEDSHSCFVLPMMVLVRKPDIYLNPALHSWEVDLSP